MDRRNFLQTLAMLSFTTTILPACGSGSSANGGYGGSGNGAQSGGGGGSGTGICANGSRVTYVNPGHSHTTVALSQAQVIAGVAGSYTLLGGSHDHTFTLTNADFKALQAGEAVRGLAESDGFGHGHIVDIVCA